MLYEVKYQLKSTNRKDIRKELIELFLLEKPGNEESDGASRYMYFVEEIFDYLICLKRPTQLNKGFDFSVNIENLYFKFDDTRRHKRPSHKDIFTILSLYKQSYCEQYNSIKKIIFSIYECENIDIQKETAHLPYFQNWDGEMVSIGVILASLKWLFIEQDITYWNKSGRFMLFNSFRENELV